MKDNPIPFNPGNLTISRAMACAEVLRTLYDANARGVDPETIIGQLEYARDAQLRSWGKPT